MGEVLALAHMQSQPERARAAIHCLDEGISDVGFMLYAFLRGFMAHGPYQCTLPEGFIVQKDGTFWLHPELHDSLLIYLDALQDTLNNLQDTLLPPGEV